MVFRKIIAVSLMFVVLFAWGCGEAELDEEELDGEESGLVDTSIQNWGNLSLVKDRIIDSGFRRILLSPYDPFLLISDWPPKITVLRVPTLETVMEIEPSGVADYLDACFMPNEHLLVGEGLSGLQQGDLDIPLSLNIVKIPTGEIVQELGDLQFFLDNSVNYGNSTALLGYSKRIAIQGNGLENFVENLTVINMDGERLVYHDEGVYREFRVGHGGRYYMSQVSDFGNEIRIWEVPNVLVQIIKDDWDIDEYDISPDGRYIASVDEDNEAIELFYTDDLEEVFSHPLEIRTHGASHTLNFSPDGKLLAISGKYMLKILSVPEEKTVKIIDYVELGRQFGENHVLGDGDTGAAFTADGKYLVLDFGSEHILIWEPE